MCSLTINNLHTTILYISLLTALKPSHFVTITATSSTATDAAVTSTMLQSSSGTDMTSTPANTPSTVNNKTTPTPSVTTDKTDVTMLSTASETASATVKIENSGEIFAS